MHRGKYTKKGQIPNEQKHSATVKREKKKKGKKQKKLM